MNHVPRFLDSNNYVCVYVSPKGWVDYVCLSLNLASKLQDFDSLTFFCRHMTRRNRH